MAFFEGGSLKETAALLRDEVNVTGRPASGADSPLAVPVRRRC
jgi:hypothetical protein